MKAEAVELIDEREAARRLALSVAALRKMRTEKRGPQWTKLGRSVRYPVRQMNDWISANMRTA